MQIKLACSAADCMALKSILATLPLYEQIMNPTGNATRNASIILTGSTKCSSNYALEKMDR
jgi:hypothetical protein